MKQQVTVEVSIIEKAFLNHHEGLHRYAYTITRNGETARDIVQKVFLGLLEKMESLAISESLQAYLYKAVYYQAINHNSRKKKLVPVELMVDQTGTGNASDRLDEGEARRKIKLAIDHLPEQCRKIFLMNREEYKTYAEISVELGIAVKTVEAQMTKALKILRSELSDLLYLFLIIQAFYN